MHPDSLEAWLCVCVCVCVYVCVCVCVCLGWVHMPVVFSVGYAEVPGLLVGLPCSYLVCHTHTHTHTHSAQALHFKDSRV